MALKTYALTTVARLSSFLGVDTPSNPSDKNTLYENLINSATDFIENRIGFRIKKTTYTNEEYDTEEGDVIDLKNYPVDSGSPFTLQRRNSGLNEDNWETIDSQYYHVNYEAGIVYAAGKFFKSRRGYRVSYSAGYNFDNAATFLSDTEAADLELACWMLVASLVQRGKGAGVVEESIGDYSVKYAKSILENDDLAAILDKYVRIPLVGPLTPDLYV